MRIDWELYKEDICRIALEEIALRGISGYQRRTVNRLRNENIVAISTDSLFRGLSRHIINWQELKEEAGKAFEENDSASLVLEVKPAPLPEAHPQILELKGQLQESKKQERETRKQLSVSLQEKTITGEIISYLQENMKPLEYSEIPLIEQKDGQRDADMVLLLSDEHSDLVVSPEFTHGLEWYNYNVFRARLERLTNVVSEFASIHLPNYTFDKLWIMSLGDKIQGSIHGYKKINHFKNDILGALSAIDAEAEMIQRLMPYFNSIHFIGVSGNHPRTTINKQNQDPTDNLDYLIGAGIAQRLSNYIEEGRLSVTLPRAWTAFVNVRGWRFALNHGDSVKGYAGIPWYGFTRRNNRVQTLHAVASGGENIDFHCYGHFHTSMTMTETGFKSIHNGAFYMTDPFALSQLAVGSNPEQRLMILEDKKPFRGVIAEIPIYLRDEEQEAKLHAGEWEPSIGSNNILDIVSGDWNPGEFTLIK